MRKTNVTQLTIAALLTAVGIIIPQIMPKIVLGGASSTLFSHVAIFMAIFFGQKVAIIVTIGTSIGFLISTANPVITARAFSHLIFVIIACKYLEKKPQTIINEKGKFKYMTLSCQWFNFWIALIHVACELVVILLFALKTGTNATYSGVGLGMLIAGQAIIGIPHSMLDAIVACFLVDRMQGFVKFPLLEESRIRLEKSK